MAVLAVLDWILRSRRAAATGTGLSACALATGDVDRHFMSVIVALTMILILYALIRHGLLASFALIACSSLFESIPPSHSPDAWYVGSSHASVALLLLILAWVAWPLLKKEKRKKQLPGTQLPQ